jgi:hypothetical protein
MNHSSFITWMQEELTPSTWCILSKAGLCAKVIQKLTRRGNFLFDSKQPSAIFASPLVPCRLWEHHSEFVGEHS